MRGTPAPWTIRESGEANETILVDPADHWFACIRHNGEYMPIKQKADALLIAASPDLYAACDAADTAFAVLYISDLTPQARSCVREAWPLVQQARAKVNPTGAYAEEVAEAQQHEIARLDRVVAQLVEALAGTSKALDRMIYTHDADSIEAEWIGHANEALRSAKWGGVEP